MLFSRTDTPGKGGGITQAFQTMNEVAGAVVLVELVQVEISQVVVGDLLGKQVIDRRQDPMGYGHRGALVPAPGLTLGLHLLELPNAASPDGGWLVSN